MPNDSVVIEGYGIPIHYMVPVSREVDQGSWLCIFWSDQIAGCTIFRNHFLQGRKITFFSTKSTFSIDLV